MGTVKNEHDLKVLQTVCWFCAATVKCDQVNILHKNKVMGGIKSTNFSLYYFDKKNHLERMPVAVKNISDLFYMARELRESDKLYLVSNQ